MGVRETQDFDLPLGYGLNGAAVWQTDGAAARVLRWSQRLEQGRVSWTGRLWVAAYHGRLARPWIRAWLKWREGGMMFSPTWRAIARIWHSVEVGAYTYGPELKPGDLPPGTRIGRYCSLAVGLVILRRNHPLDFVSQHPLFFNARLGFLSTDALPPPSNRPLHVGHDVWIGARVIILPGCSEIGDGAIIGAGSVVTHDVAPFTIVAGNPAREIRPRFPPEIEACVRASRWWERSLQELLPRRELFMQRLNLERAQQLALLYGAARPTATGSP